MSRASRIIVADADAKNAALLAFGFEREGLEPLVVQAAADVPRMAIAGNVDGVVLSMPSGGQTAEALKGLRAAGPLVAKLPVLALGDAATRTEALTAGAIDFLPRPNFVRDVVAMVRFHTLRKPSTPSVWAGELGDFAGIFFLIRGLSSTGRTGVLTIVRSLRRAELRFYEGEVTSAQVGSLHGMAALHQVLLWTEGKLDFRAESVVRRQQIPLAPGELIDDLGRFLRDFHELAPDLGPGVVLEQDLRRVAECVDKIPKEVNPVLRLFDGARMLSDIVEDSPFRVFETVKIAARLVKLGALKAVVQSRTRGDNSALKVDDWLVGSTPVQGVPAIMTGKDSEPVGPQPGTPASPPGAAASESVANAASARQKKKAKKERERAAAGAAPVAGAAPAGDGVVAAAVKPAASEPTDWGRLTGAASSVWDLPGYAPVVPSQVAMGEISSIARPSPDLATAGKVVAQDLAAAVQDAVRNIHTSTTPKVLVEDMSAVPSPPTIRGKAAERVDEISAPVPQPIAATPAVQTLPGPAPAPLARASRVTAPPVTEVASVVVAPEMESRVHAPSSTMSVDSGGVISGVLSGALESRAAAPEPSRLEYAEKIVVIDADFDPPRPPSVEIEIIRAPEDAELPEDRTDIDQAAAPPAPAPRTSAPALRSIADEEPSDAVAARLPNVVVAPQGLAKVALPGMPAAHVAAPAAIVTATPSAPTVQVVAPPSRLAAPPVAAEPSVIVAAPAPVVSIPAPVVAVAPPAVVAPAPAVAAVAEQAARSAADAAQAAARALAFDAIDEEFFNQEHQFANAKAHPSESFDDLDGHHHAPAASRRGFWSRLLGGAPQPQVQRRRPTTVPPPTGARTGSATGPQKTQGGTGPQKTQPGTGPQKTQGGTGPQKTQPGGKGGAGGKKR